MTNSGGDVLARGGISAQFRASESTVSQEKWNEAFGDQLSAFEERLRQKAIAEGLTEEQFREMKQQVDQRLQQEIEEKKRESKEVQLKNLKIRPIQDRIIVCREEIQEKSGDVYLPDEAKEKPAEGIVIAVGPGRFLANGEFVPTSVKVGERVLFGKYSGAEVRVGLVDLTVLREEDIFFVKEKENNE